MTNARGSTAGYARLSLDESRLARINNAMNSSVRDFSNMARSPEKCAKAAKARWAKYHEDRKLLERFRKLAKKK